MLRWLFLLPVCEIFQDAFERLISGRDICSDKNRHRVAKQRNASSKEPFWEMFCNVYGIVGNAWILYFEWYWQLILNLFLNIWNGSLQFNQNTEMKAPSFNAIGKLMPSFFFFFDCQLIIKLIVNSKITWLF